MLSQAFCASPWIHMRITNQGDYEYCRWMNEYIPGPTGNIKNIGPIEYFQTTMANVRLQLLDGIKPKSCVECHNMEEFGKLSGRQRQLLKVGVKTDNFLKTMASSPFYLEFEKSFNNQGLTECTPQDWHIDLGNYCNSACIMCVPEFSSRLATEFHRIGIIDKTPAPNWTDDPELVEKFTQDLLKCRNLKFLHFLGGETIITPAFKQILKLLVDAGIGPNTDIGFTTNLTVWDDEIIDLVSNFNQVHLNMSVETLDELNDYVRYPSNIDVVRRNLDQWVNLGKKRQWLMTLRVTPTALSIHRVWSVYEYAINANLNVESCNFLHNPSFMRPTVLPIDIRLQIADELESNIQTAITTIDTDQIINIRNPEFAAQAAAQDALSYVKYLRCAKAEPELLPNLISYLNKLEHSRGNSILDYLPEYENILRPTR